MDKNSLLSIGLFSEYTGIPVTTLLYYDKKGLFKPALRGENNYRYYSYFQTISIKLINVLKNCGVPLNKIKAITKNRTPEELLELLLIKEKEIPLELEQLQESLKLVKVFRNNICKGLSIVNDEVSQSYMTGDSFTLGPPNDFSSDDSFYGAYQRYIRHTIGSGGNLCYPVGGWWSSFDKYIEKPTRPERFISSDPDGDHSRPPGKYLVGYARCFYGEPTNLPERIAGYASAHYLDFDGPLINIFLLDEVSIIEPDRYLLQASIKVK